MPLLKIFFLYSFIFNVYFLFQYIYGDYEAEYHFIRKQGQELVLLKNRGIMHFEIVTIKKKVLDRKDPCLPHFLII